MPAVLYCLFAVSFMPILVAWIAAVLRVRQFGKFDNHHPRLQQAQLTGVGARAVGAQANSWEALMMFTASLVIAHAAGVELQGLTTAGLVFVAARVAYIGLYLANQATARSLAFTVGAGACLHIVWQAAHVAP